MTASLKDRFASLLRPFAHTFQAVVAVGSGGGGSAAEATTIIRYGHAQLPGVKGEMDSDGFRAGVADCVRNGFLADAKELGFDFGRQRAIGPLDTEFDARG